MLHPNEPVRGCPWNDPQGSLNLFRKSDSYSHLAHSVNPLCNELEQNAKAVQHLVK